MNRRVLIAGAILIFITGIATILALSLRPAQMTDGARAVADVPFLVVKSTPPGVLTSYYFWMSDHEFLYSENNHLRKLDITNGKSTEIGQGSLGNFLAGVPLLSPDHTRLLTYKLVNQKRIPVIRRIYPRPGEVSDIPLTLPPPPRDQYSGIFWLPDSRRVAIMTWNAAGTPYWLVYDENHPAKPQRLPFPPAAWAAYILAITPNSEAVVEEEMDPDIQQGQIWPQFSHFRYWRFSFGTRRTTPPVSFLTPFTRSTGTLDVRPISISPDGTKVLWWERSTSPWRQRIAESIQGITMARAPSEARKIYRLILGEAIVRYWVSEVDGGNFVNLGSIDNVLRGDDSGLTWMPDSKHISFVFKGKLYLRSVP